MTSKEKARELYDKFMDEIDLTGETYGHHKAAKQCALICVDEISNALIDDRIIYGSEYLYQADKYWQQVKEEINKL